LDTTETKVEANEMSEFEHFFEEIKKEMRKSAERLEKKLQELAEDEMQNSMLRFKEYHITKKNEEISSNIAATNDINDSIIIATSTGTTATILPSVELNLHTDNTDTTNTNNNNNYNNNNNNIASIAYVEKYYCSEYSDDDAFLASKDYDFVSSIQSTTSIGICLPPILWNTSNFSSLATTILPKLVNNAYQCKVLSTISSRSNTFKAVTVLSNLMNYYNFNIRFPFYNIYLYRIFIWDPGILYITNLYFYFT